MSVVRQTTKYHCDGCGYETEQAHEWRSFILVGSGMVTISGTGYSEDFCPSCIGKMRASLRQPAKVE